MPDFSCSLFSSLTILVRMVCPLVDSNAHSSRHT
jgi:hypothetical protein